tara:strand:+ start:50 stop:370 length:321 start_codon:yes stop_codon:yes gene_type:complete
MRAVTLTTSGTSVSAPYPLDTYISPFNVGFAVVVTGTVTYSVQHTFDNPFAAGFTPASATWFNHEDLVAQTTSQDGNYAFPVRAIRVNQTAGSGSTSSIFIQTGIA